MTLGEMHTLAFAAGIHALPGMFSSSSKSQALAQAVSSLSNAVIGSTEYLKSNV